MKLIEQLKKLKEWRQLECPRCEFYSECPREIINLKLCMTDETTFDELHYLIKKTLRRICTDDRKKRRSQQRIKSGQKIERPYAIKPQHVYAYLYCADQEEFRRCRR